MKTCSNCGWWEFAGERGTWGQCAHPTMKAVALRCSGTRVLFCAQWLPRCTECGEPAYSEMVVYSDDEPPISAHYCDECADELGIGREEE